MRISGSGSLWAAGCIIERGRYRGESDSGTRDFIVRFRLSMEL